MSNTNIIKELPTHLIATAITFLSNYHNIVTKDPNVSVWYETNVLGCIKHLQEVLDETNNTSAPNKEVVNNASIVNKHLKEDYEMLLSMLSEDPSNTDLMDKIKAFKLLYPNITEQY